MDTTALRPLDGYAFALDRDTGAQQAAVVFYGDRQLLADMDEKVMEQIRNVARLPGIVGGR